MLVLREPVQHYMDALLRSNLTGLAGQKRFATGNGGEVLARVAGFGDICFGSSPLQVMPRRPISPYYFADPPSTLRVAPLPRP